MSDDWLPGRKNRAGVYCPTETLELPRAVKSWRGVQRVEIKLVQTSEGWRSALSFSFFTGSHWGQGHPICDSCALHSTREAAISEQVTWMHACFAKLDDPAMQREAREMLAWADSLFPAQADLFSQTLAA